MRKRVGGRAVHLRTERRSPGRRVKRAPRAWSRRQAVRGGGSRICELNQGKAKGVGARLGFGFWVWRGGVGRKSLMNSAFSAEDTVARHRDYGSPRSTRTSIPRPPRR